MDKCGRTSMIVATATGALLVAGCSAGARHSKPSLTPSVTPAPSSPLRAGLVTRADLDGDPSLAGFTVAPIVPGQVFTDPDSRGPCGTPIVQPDFQTGAGETLLGPAIGAQLVVRVDPAAATTFVTAMQHDTRAGCPKWQSRTNTGGTQTGQLIAAVPLDVPADQATAAVVTITPAGQPVGVYFSEVVIRDGGTLSVTILIGAQPRPGELETLAQRAASRLRAVGS